MFQNEKTGTSGTKEDCNHDLKLGYETFFFNMKTKSQYIEMTKLLVKILFQRPILASNLVSYLQNFYLTTF